MPVYGAEDDAATLVEQAASLMDAGDYEAALVPLLEAVEMGDASAQNKLGYCYLKGYGVEKSYEKAAKYFRLAADQGLDRAQYSTIWGVCIILEIA